MIETFLFFGFSGLLLAAAFMTVFSNQLVHSALWLVLSFFTAAALWVSLEAEFLGLVLIFVYVGAVLTLFLFVIMTLPIKPAPSLTQLFGVVGHYGFPCVLIGSWLSIIGYSVYQYSQSLPTLKQEITNLQALGNAQHIGSQLYTQYVYPFELAGILLLVAIIASITLRREDKKTSKPITKHAQLNIKREERIKLVTGD